MGSLSPVMQQVMVMMLAAILAAPGMLALWRGLHQADEEKLMRLQVDALADEVKRLQVLTDDQARELAKLRVELGTLRATQKSLIDVSKRLATQIKALGAVPIVDPENLETLLP